MYQLLNYGYLTYDKLDLIRQPGRKYHEDERFVSDNFKLIGFSHMQSVPEKSTF